MITSGGIIGVVERVMEDDRIEVIIGEGIKFRLLDQRSQVCLKRRSKKIILFRA